MTTTSDDLPLAAEFAPASYEQWRKLVDGMLKGAPFERLTAKTYDGLTIAPLNPRKADARPVTGRAPGAPWRIMQRLDHPEPATANAEALHDLENGAAGLSLICAGAVGAFGYGLTPSKDALAAALAGVHLDAGIALDVDSGPHGQSVARLLADHVLQAGTSLTATDVRFGVDPIGAAAAAGGSPSPWASLAPAFSRAVIDLREKGCRGPVAVADGRLVHNAGGSEAQELAYVIAIAVQYLRALEAAGLALHDARGLIYFRLAADVDQLLTIAKFRALRRLWARVEEACGLTPGRCIVSAETAWRMMTRRDPYVNMLRSTIAVVSAGLGGADAITVLPFTLALGLPDRFARRLARNTQLVLLEESHLAKVADPATGAGGIEELTDQLCRTVWVEFQQTEQTGGAWAALEQGVIQRKIAAVRAEREKAVARRKDSLTGTSDFPHLSEAQVAVLDVPRAISRPATHANAFEPLPARRLAEPFEALRDASDRILAETGQRPRVFLANLGALAEFTARATFAKNIFEAGGIEAIGNVGFASREEMVAAFKSSGARLACICSSEDVYAREAEAAARALADAGGTIFLAGRPGALEAPLKAAGVRSFIYIGCDLLAFLRDAYSDIR
ncbi:MAG: methylmalonyl-CoA mutase small subunit [Hyphomicrobiales bacterium]|nr:methylmalonyl-CoA mutase small subunit [Hyphomicrobiales bacterium]